MTLVPESVWCWVSGNDAFSLENDICSVKVSLKFKIKIKIRINYGTMPHQYKNSEKQAEGSALLVLLDQIGPYISGVVAE